MTSAARTQCEARTKSGTRCKRNALPGEKLCRQHKKIEERRRPAQQPSGPKRMKRGPHDETGTVPRCKVRAEGVADGSYRGEFHSLVTGDDLFVDV